MTPATTGCGCKWNMKYRSANLIHSPISLIYWKCSQLFTLLVSTYKGNSDLMNVSACSPVFSAFTWIPFLSRASKWSKEERERKKKSIPWEATTFSTGSPIWDVLIVICSERAQLTIVYSECACNLLCMVNQRSTWSQWRWGKKSIFCIAASKLINCWLWLLSCPTANPFIP